MRENLASECLAGREAAIVSAQAGTTRDVVEVRMELGGVPVLLADTAGLREAPDEIEAEGVRRARRRAEEADMRPGRLRRRCRPDAETLALRLPDTLVVVNKTDLGARRLSIGGGHRWRVRPHRGRGWMRCGALTRWRPRRGPV
jgi:tRNA modification GTPase